MEPKPDTNGTVTSVMVARWSRDGRGMVAGMDRKWTVNGPTQL